jgi:omega-amidase
MIHQAPTEPLELLLVQAQLCWQAPAINRAHLAELVGDQAQGADLVVFPETFTTGFLGDESTPAEGLDGPSVAWMQGLARDNDTAVCGSAVIHDDNGKHNRFLFVSPTGESWYYDKKHLFAHAGEDHRYQAGDQRVVVNWRGWRICLQVCYDLRFPVWCRNRDDYDLLLFVANWPEKRIDAWDALLKARAIENQSFVAAVNRVGEDGFGKHYPGHSAVFDALGQQIAFLAGEETCQRVSLDPAALVNVRQSLPFQRDADPFHID